MQTNTLALIIAVSFVLSYAAGVKKGKSYLVLLMVDHIKARLVTAAQFLLFLL